MIARNTATHENRPNVGRARACVISTPVPVEMHRLEAKNGYWQTRVEGAREVINPPIRDKVGREGGWVSIRHKASADYTPDHLLRNSPNRVGSKKF